MWRLPLEIIGKLSTEKLHDNEKLAKVTCNFAEQLAVEHVQFVGKGRFLVCQRFQTLPFLLLSRQSEIVLVVGHFNIVFSLSLNSAEFRLSQGHLSKSVFVQLVGLRGRSRVKQGQRGNLKSLKWYLFVFTLILFPLFDLSVKPSLLLLFLIENALLVAQVFALKPVSFYLISLTVIV